MTSVNNSKLLIDNNKATTLINFYKIFKDLIIDLDTSFKDKLGEVIQTNKDYQNIISYCLPNYIDNMNADEYVNSIELTLLSIDFMESLNNVYEYCKRTFAIRSIDILYQNEDIFLNKSNVKVDDENSPIINTMFLPDIEFSELYYDDTSEQTKQTLWKYLQLILFNIITSIDDISFFGDSLELLKIIDGEKFSSKIQSTIEELANIFSHKEKSEAKDDIAKDDDLAKDDLTNATPDFAKLFDVSNNPFNMFANMLNDLPENLHNNESSNNESSNNESSNNKSSNNNDYNIPDKDELFSHINKLINGKIGSLAKEIAEETTKDMDIDTENITDVNDVLKGFMKNPTKLLGLISKISNKINSKMKDGSLKESELLEEATSIFKNMKDMPGMGNFNDIFKSMNLDQFMPKGGKINPGAFQNMMEQNVKMSQMKERMRKKAENKNTSATGETSKTNVTNGENNDSNKFKTKLSDNIKLDDLTSNLSSLMKEMENNSSFIDDIIKKQAQHRASGEVSARSSDENSKHKSNNKRKANKKK